MTDQQGPDLTHFLAEVKKTAGKLRNYNDKKVVNISDTDADGISSAYCIRQLGRAMRWDVQTVFIERPFRRVWEHIYKNTEGIVIITDHGGDSVQSLASVAGSRPTIVIDHHGRVHNEGQHDLPDTFHLLNTNCYGIHGDRYASSSTIAGTLALNTTPKVAKDCHKFLIGSIGDRNHLKRQGQLAPRGIDDIVLQACDREKFYYDNREPDPTRRYKIELNDSRTYHASSFAELLTKIGCVHKPQGRKTNHSGPEFGMQLLEQGKVPLRDPLASFENFIARRYQKARNHLRQRPSQLAVTENVFGFAIDDEFRYLALKSIGDFSNWLIQKSERNPKGAQKLPEIGYIMGAMPVPHQNVLGTLLRPFDDEEPRYKISIRTTPAMQQRIREGRAPTVRDIIVEFTEKSGQNSHDDRGAGIVLVSDYKHLAKDIQNYYRHWKK